MKIIAIIQARMGSTRLPGKVMKKLCGKSVLAHVINRVKACPLVEQVVVATTILPTDDILIYETEKCGAKWFRGSEGNVLERYYLAAKEYEADIIVRVTSDCPLFDPEVLLKLLIYFIEETSKRHKIDYLSNCLSRSYPRGLDTEIFTFEALQTTFNLANKSYEKEHVTPYIYEHPEIFYLCGQRLDRDLSHHRWTLDTEDDWKLINIIFSELYQEGQIFGTYDVLDLLEKKPELVKLNACVKQKELQY